MSADGRGRPRKPCGHDPQERVAWISARGQRRTRCRECARQTTRAYQERRRGARALVDVTSSIAPLPEPTEDDALTGGEWVRTAGGIYRWTPRRAA